MDTLQLTDGRDLDYEVTGDPDNPVLLFHHGTPGSLSTPRSTVRAASDSGLRLLSYSRAGSGGSTRHPDRSVADVVPDLVQLLDHLGVERCVTAGWSGGGPHCLAMGALAPDRVTGVLSIAGAAPYDADGLDFLAGMGEDNIEEFTAALAGEAALRELLDPIAPELAHADAAEVVESLSGLLPPVDREKLTGELGEDLAAGMREALRLGYDGWLDDDLAFVKHWGFGVDEITVPTIVLQGDQDLMVPFAHGQWLASHVPGADARLLIGEGHLSLVDAASQAFGDLRATLSR